MIRTCNQCSRPCVANRHRGPIPDGHARYWGHGLCRKCYRVAYRLAHTEPRVTDYAPCQECGTVRRIRRGRAGSGLCWTCWVAAKQDAPLAEDTEGIELTGGTWVLRGAVRVWREDVAA